MNEEQIRQIVRDELAKAGASRITLNKDVQLFEGRNVILGKTYGTKIGTEATQKLSVFGATPVVQANAISAPSGGGTVDTQARTAISSLITAIKSFGITA